VQAYSQELWIMNTAQWAPVTAENCQHVYGPFYHGTKVDLAVGELLSPGYPSNYEEGRVSNHLYFSALLEPAIWGAELAMALARLEGRGRIYIVEPTGAFEDDPNLTNKRFPGNPTQSYRTREPLRIVDVVEDWQGHPEEVVRGMVDSLLGLQRQGMAVIED
jgi:rifampin ADP-ribosylating transferase